MTPLYPLVFRPIFKPRIWGGEQLRTVLGKEIPAGPAIGESWELCDLESDQSVVANGPAAGKTLGQLVEEWGADLLGGCALSEGRFPLLIKFLDAREALSVQVHPDEAFAARRGKTVRVKHEAWYVVDAAPDACIYRGLKDDVTPDGFRRALEAGQVDALLDRIAARKGHAFYLPSGTIHALGGGTLVAEVQTPSDVTFRVFDWNRLDAATGRPRDLHVEEALESMHFGRQAFAEDRISHVASVWTTVTTLVRCPYFAMDRVRMVAGVEQAIPLDGFVVWMILDGRCSITAPGCGDAHEFARGDTVLIPGGLKGGTVRTVEPCMWLEVSIPQSSTLAQFDRPMRESFEPSALVERFVSLRTPQRNDEK